MQLLKVLRTIERLDYLIRNSATGSPKQLAHRLNISERQLYRLMDEMKNAGFPIIYSKSKRSYQYESENEVELNIQIKIHNQKIVDILR